MLLVEKNGDFNKDGPPLEPKMKRRRKDQNPCAIDN